MVHNQNEKIVMLVQPAVIVDDASIAITELDTLGYEYCTIYCAIGATDIAWSAMKLTEGDASGSGHTDITASVYGTATNVAGSTSTLPTADSDNTILAWDLDLRGLKRYIDGVVTVGNGSAGSYAVMWAVLSRAHETPSTTAERGLAQALRV